MRITRNAFENYLNDSYSPNIAECIHFTVKCSGREKPISKVKLQIKLDQKKYGTLLRKYDPVAFNVAFNDWARKYS